MKVFLLIIAMSCASLPASEIRFDSQGKFINICGDIGGFSCSYLQAPPGSQVISFDADTNTELIAAAHNDSPRMTLSGGQILVDGSPVAVNGDGSLKMSLDTAKLLWSTLKSDAAWGALSANQKAEALRQVDIYLIRALVRNGVIQPSDFQ